MSKRTLLNKNLPKNLDEASNHLKTALSDFEDAYDREKVQQDETEKKVRRRMLIKIKELLKDLS